LPRIVLKIDVDTLRGTREGVPNLARMLDRFKARATFLFSLGPDHTGWALRRVLRPGFLKKVSRTSVLEHYGIKQLMYGVLLPGPDIGRRATADMRASARCPANTRGPTCIGRTTCARAGKPGQPAKCKKAMPGSPRSSARRLPRTARQVGR